MPLADLRVETGSDYFDALGHHGQISSGGEILVGIHEGGPGKISACLFADASGCNPTTRLRKKFNCTGSGCTSVSSFPSTGRHGAHVASILLGDYEQNQGSAYESQIAQGVGSNWRELATGFAREAEGHYYYVGGDESDKVDGFECAQNIGPSACATMDIVHSANPILEGACDPASGRIIEAAAEQLFDDGVLPIVISHNDRRSNDLCTVRSPADIPKVFTVGALQPETNVDYHDWDIAGYSNRGGGPIRVGFQTHPEGLSMVDLVASGLPGYVTYDDGNYGIVTGDPPCSDAPGSQLDPEDPGTSYAGPQVAGAAAQVLDYFVESGWGWATKPGRLHTILLSMGDRGHNSAAGAAGPTRPLCVSGDHILCGADFYFGLGRLSLDLALPYNHWQWTLTSTTAKSAVSAAPMPANTEILKCVMHQVEDMSSKDNISHVELTVQVRPPHPTLGCQRDYGTVSTMRADRSVDDKKMVAILDSHSNLGGQCYEVSWNVITLSSAGKTSFHTFCSTDDNLEY